MSDTRRDQLTEFIEREFIGPDPIHWPGMTTTDGQEILKSDPPRTRYIAGVLFPRESKEDHMESEEEEELPEVEQNPQEDAGVLPTAASEKTNRDFLEAAEELINRSNDYRQSAISITVAIKSQDQIRVLVTAGSYKTLTIKDPNGKAPVYDEVVQQLEYKNFVGMT